MFHPGLNLLACSQYRVPRSKLQANFSQISFIFSGYRIIAFDKFLVLFYFAFVTFKLLWVDILFCYTLKIIIADSRGTKKALAGLYIFQIIHVLRSHVFPTYQH